MSYIANSPARRKSRGSPSGFARPLWRTAMAPQTWEVVPVSRTLAQEDPALDPTLNPNSPASAPWRGSDGALGTLDAWGCLLPSSDEADGRVWMPLGGGHGNYGGNEAYVINLASESPAWSRISRPSGNLVDGLLAYADGDYTTGEYPDGRIRAKHGYTDFVHIPGTNKIACMRLSTGFAGGSTTAHRSWIIDGVTGAHSLLSNYSGLAGRGGVHGGGSCWDTTRNVIWHHGATSSGKMLQTNPDTGVTIEVGPSDNRIGAICQMVYVPTIDRVMVLVPYFSSLMHEFNPNTGAWSYVFSISGTQPAGFSGLYRRAGPVWVPSLNAIAMWDNSGSTTNITLLRPPGNGSGWRWDTLSPASGDVAPANMDPDGTFGKFGYSKALNGFYLQPTYSSPMCFFSLD